MRRRARTDANQHAIVRDLRAVGCSVQSLAAVGDGCPDILVGRNGACYVMEIKDGSKPPSERRLTPAEQEWHDNWRGQKAIVTSSEEAFRVVGI